MTRNLLKLTCLMMCVSPTAVAQSVASGQCEGAQIYGDGEVRIQITARQIRSASSARSVTDYGVSLGANNSMESLCMNGGGAVVLTLPSGGRYAFQDIRFEYPYGFEPVASPFKLAVIHPDSVIFHMHSSAVSDGLSFKYTVTVKDLQTGALLVIDPEIKNRPPA